jgi:peptide/nickel transport system substrate-binding protein
MEEEMSRKLSVVLSVLLLASLALALSQCGATPEPVTIVQTVEVEKPVVQTVEVAKEVVQTVEVPKEVVQTVEVVKEVAPSKAGGELVVRIPEDMENFDTHTDQLQVFRSVIQWTIFEPLVQYDDSLKLNGILAESWENPQPTVWRFHLRKGVKFHDGSDFTAEDAKYSLDRVKDPATASWLIGNLANMVKAEVVDDYTLDVTLDSTVASFLDKLAVIGIMPKGSGDTQRRAPIGSGPFKFVEDVPNEHVIVEKFADYWQTGLPYLDKITFRPIPEAAVALADLEAGDIDFSTMMSPNEAAAALQIPGATLTVQPATTSLMFFEVNRRVEPLNDPKVFAALIKCLDRDAVGKLVNQGYGTATNVPIAPASQYHKDIPWVYDPEAAKAELEALGYKPGDIKLEIISWGGYKNLENMAVIWKDGLGKAGVDVTVTVLEVQVMLDRYNKHDFDIATNLYAPPPDPDVYYDIIWGPRLADDYTQHPEASQLIADGRKTTDPAERKAIYDQLQDLSATDGPCVDVWFEASMAAHKVAVRDVKLTPMVEYFFHTAWLEKAQ